MSLPESFLRDAPTPGPVAIPTPREHTTEVTATMIRTAAKPKLAHSAGPFTVERQSDKGGWTGVSIRDAGGFYIANLVMQLGENEMANARLLAASAEMKDALELLLAAKASDTLYMDTHWMQARAALAKARG